MEVKLPKQPSETADTHVLACEEVWGGTQKVDQAVELPGLRGWVCSMPFEASTRGGDIYYFSACDQGLISRVALADVSGHGCDVASVAEKLLQLIRRHISTWDQSELPLTSPEVVGRALLSAVRKFRHGRPAEDDETLIVLHRP